MPNAYIKNLPQESGNLMEDGNPPQGNDTPTEGGNPPQEGNDTPTEDGNPPQEGNDTPTEGGNPPQEGNDTPTEGGNPPQEGDEPPQEGGNPPQEGDEPPQEGDTPTEGGNPPQEGDTPTEGDTPAGDENPMQKVLDDLRESLDRKDSDVETLTESIRSLTEIMSAKLDTSVTDLAFSGWRDWTYPVRMDFTVHPWGAGYDMEQTERIETADALLARYNELFGLCQDGGTLRYFYIRYIWEDIDSDGNERLVYDYEAKDEPVQDIAVPFEGWEGWSYPVTVDFTVHPWGAGYDMDVTETYDTPEAFKTDYSKNVKLCGDGGTLKDYRIRYITDSGGTTVYDGTHAEEPPAEDLTPVILETLQSIDARLEGIDSLSANTLDYYGKTLDHYEDTLHLYKEQNALLTNTLALNMAILFLLVVSFGHKIAHAFWQRMRVG